MKNNPALILRGINVPVTDAWVDFCEEEIPEELNLIEVKSLINDLVREVTSRLNQGYSVDITLNGKIVVTYYPDGRVKEYDL